MAQITECAPDLFRMTTFLEPFNLQFSQFLVRDAEPLLFHRLTYQDQGRDQRAVPPARPRGPPSPRGSRPQGT